MRIRIALATAVAVILIPVVLLLTVFSGSPSASVPVSARHEAIGQHRVTTHVKPMTNSQTAKAAQLAAFYQAVQASQLTAFYQAVQASQLAAFYNAINNAQLAAFYNAVEAHQQQVASAAAAAPAQAPATSGGGSGSWSGPWACIAQQESSGNASADTGNGYYGGLQFSQSTWDAYGGTGSPASASIAEQEAVASRVQAAQGWSAWPNSSQQCGL